MKILLTPRFAREFKRLSSEIQNLAKEKIRLFQNDPFSPPLRSHKLHGNLKKFCSFSINQKYRIIFTLKDKTEAVLYSVGTHGIY